MPTLSKNRDLPAAITRLRLCSALRDCGRSESGVEAAFDKSDDENLYVYDNEKLGCSDWTNDEHEVSLSKTFHAQNPNRNTLVLLPLDGCIITGKNLGLRCDCALLTDKELSFVEFKTNVSSTKALTILQRATEAKDQLWHTYDGIIKPKCQKLGVDISSKVKIDFYVVFNSDLSVTGARADFQNLQNEFLQEKHYPLYFRNNKQFE